MSCHFSPPAQNVSIMPAVLIETARCWREARNNREPVQPKLFALLSPYGQGMLAPAFDSLMTLAESVAGKPMATGNGPVLSDDETRLVDLFTGDGASSGGEGLAGPLACAVKSLRVLLTRSLEAATISLAR